MKLEHKYLTPRNPDSYNATQLRTSVHGSQFIEFLQLQKPPRFSLLQKQLMCLGIVAACAFLLAFEIGLIDYLEFLFR